MSSKDHFDAFRYAITWSEPFIMGLIAFHAFAFLATVFVTRRHGMVPRLILLTVMAGIVRSAEWLNAYGAKNWETFATQNYFDNNGIFISIMISAPLLLMSFFMLISYLREASTLLVEVKRHELKGKQKQGNVTRSKKSGKPNKKED